jgi:hypothetical protein
MSADDLMGLVPLDVDPWGRSVTLVSAGSAWFNEPFYRTTLGHLCANGRVRRRTLTYRALHDELGDDRPAPAGLVLHTSRCGSTLLAKMLRHDRTRLVLGEPPPVGRAHHLSLDEPDDTEVAALVTDLLVLLERFATRRHQRSVVKLSSWQAVATDDLADRFPETPLVFMHRPAHEVVASLLAQRPSWAPSPQGGPGPAINDRGSLPTTITAGIDPTLDATGYFASLWATLARAALAGPAERIHFVALGDLRDDPIPVLTGVAAHLGLDGSFDPVRAAGELDYYAKSADPTERFEADARHARPPLTDEQRALVSIIVDDLPARLDERTAGRCPRTTTAQVGPPHG